MQLGRITQLNHGRPRREQGKPLNLVVEPKPVVRPGPKPRVEGPLTDIQVVKREAADRIKELIEANNRELERRRALWVTMGAILVRSNCQVTREMAQKALNKDDALAKRGGE